MRVPVSPRRVLVTADAVGGVWTYALDLARGLAAEGVTTALAVLGPAPDAAAQAAAEAVPGLDLLVTGLPLDWTAARPCEVAAAGEAVAALADALDVDLVHLNGPALAARARFPRPVVAVSHSCVATWWAAVRSGPLPADLAWRAELHGAGLRAVTLTLAPSRAHAAATAAAYSLPAPPRAVHNGRALPAPRRAEAAPFVLTAGRLWDDGKNVAALDRTAPGLPCPVVALGSTRGPNGAAIQLRHAEAPGAVGPEIVADHLARATLYVSPAAYEPFGLAVLEAAGADCPLVLSDIRTFRELWDDAAAFVPPGDDAALRETITRLLAEPEARRRLAEAAQARAARYTVESMVAGTLAAYRDALAARPDEAAA